MTRAKATLHWLTPEEGGRQTPAGDGYAAIAGFPNVDANDAWSIVVEKIEGETAIVRMLAPEAPADTLTPGRALAIYEGRRCVARGRVTEVIE